MPIYTDPNGNQIALGDYVDFGGRPQRTERPINFGPVAGPSPQPAPVPAPSQMVTAALPGQSPLGPGILNPASVYGSVWDLLLRSTGNPQVKEHARRVLESLDGIITYRTYGVAAYALSASATQSTDLTVRQGEFFLALQLLGASDLAAPNYTFLLEAVANTIPYMNTPIRSSLILGTAGQPYNLPVPIIFGPGERFRFTYSERGAAANVLDTHIAGVGIDVLDR